MKTHKLKTTPQFFEPVWDRKKTFEIRYDDRAYQRGDRVLLLEWDPSVRCSCKASSSSPHLDDCPRYTGRWLTAEIGHVTASTPSLGSQRGFSGAGYVVFSLLLDGASDPALNKELQP